MTNVTEKDEEEARQRWIAAECQLLAELGIVERVRIESRAVASTPAETAQMVLASPRACRTVLESLAVDGSAGRLGAWRARPPCAAAALLCALGRAGLLLET
jgi:hypothetical protein